MLKAAVRACFCGLALVLTSLCTITLHAGAGADAITDQTLRYAATYHGMNAGEVEISLRALADGGYVVATDTKPSMLSKLFFQSYTNETRFKRVSNSSDAEVGVDSGTEHLSRGDDHRHSFHFDRARNRIEFSDGKHRDYHPDERFTAAAFPLLLMLRSPAELAQLAGSRVREVSARRLRDYIYEAPVVENIPSPAGVIPAWKITRHRADRPEERVTVWLRRDGLRIPLKIAFHKKGRAREMELIAASGAGETIAPQTAQTSDKTNNEETINRK